VLVIGGRLAAGAEVTAPIERSMEQMRRFMADAAHELAGARHDLRTRAEVASARRATRAARGRVPGDEREATAGQSWETC